MRCEWVPEQVSAVDPVVLLLEMRGWVEDCLGEGVTCGVSDDVVRRYVALRYVGGVEAFVRDGVAS